MHEYVKAMLEARRGFTVAAAGCGKTELLGRIAAHEASGRQLLLTHTHAGIAAMKKRLNDLKVPAGKYHLDTIAGFCLRYGASYPTISGMSPDAEAVPDWEAAYPGAERVLRTKLGQCVLLESYDGVLVDEYQDCSCNQHRVIEAIGRCLPCRGVGDPLQSVFGFRGDPCVSWETIRTDFDVLEDLVYPWRWKRNGKNSELGDWLAEARIELRSKGRLHIREDAPVNWIRHDGEDAAAWADACRKIGMPGESSVAILQWPNHCIELAKRLSGSWPVVEKFDDPGMLTLAADLAVADGPRAVHLLHEFFATRMTGISTDLRRIVDAIEERRSTKRFSKHVGHLERLLTLAAAPSPGTILAALEGFLSEHDWRLYRYECVYQFRAALQECRGGSLAELQDAAAEARTRARHRGRRTHRRSIGTPLLTKGLEFDHAAVLWDPEHFSLEGLYVAITRGSKTLTIVSKSRTLFPRTR
jgi:DNA helicase-2/ATP-dependent DNA helicase PcrA